MKKKRVINLRDVRMIYVFLLFTWILVLADGIVIHELARNRIIVENIMEEKALIGAVGGRINELDVDKKKLIKSLSQELTDHKCSLHYGGNKCQ